MLRRCFPYRLTLTYRSRGRETTAICLVEGLKLARMIASARSLPPPGCVTPPTPTKSMLMRSAFMPASTVFGTFLKLGAYDAYRARQAEERRVGKECRTGGSTERCK